ncbi:MAG: ribonuclease P protein component [Spirochaetes bacterium GWF1_51_8]|nr:MAG: ribonuclease P protein component [Spirochaetes bacterium GWF1_51_8]
MKSDLSFSNNNRIKNSSDFQRIYKDGNKISGYYYSAFFVAGASPESRLGVSVPKRHGKAVFRNRHKRLIREAFRHSKHLFTRPAEIVVLFKRISHQPDGYSIDLLKLFERLAEKCNS